MEKKIELPKARRLTQGQRDLLIIAFNDPTLELSNKELAIFWMEPTAHTQPFL